MASEQARQVNRMSTNEYKYVPLTGETSFRLAELLPGTGDEPIACVLHEVDWNPPDYEAISYAWGDPNIKKTILCGGRKIQVTRNLHIALTHFRYPDRSRLVWADALCISQMNIPERSKQVKQMKKIYQMAQRVQIWLGPDNDGHEAATAVDSIKLVSDFLCKTLNIDINLDDVDGDTFQAYILKNKDKLPRPDQTEFSSEALWKSLATFYSHSYFTRVWAIQEISANPSRVVNMGYSTTQWNRVDMTASYIIMDPTFSDQYNFGKANCWWVATIAEIAMHPQRWLNMLYLASSYGCLDPRDVIYGLRGMMDLGEGATLLEPDYNKTREEVYRDTVNAALVNFKKTDVLTYVTGKETPSWVPAWDTPMIFRNPFRFGKPMPWQPSGNTEARWSIDAEANMLTLQGSIVDHIADSATYSQIWFADSTIAKSGVNPSLQLSWLNIVEMLGKMQESLPLLPDTLRAAAIALSFGLDHKLKASDESILLHRFVAYLGIIFANDEESLSRYISAQLLEEARGTDGREFGKPVWDFDYPDASIFVTRKKSVGCAIATTQKDDVVLVPAGSTYPLVLRPQGISAVQERYRIRGFCYVHGIMMAGNEKFETTDVNIV